MISPSDRALVVELIQEAYQNGARLAPACKELNISVRTYQRWVSEGGVKEDQRPLVARVGSIKRTYCERLPSPSTSTYKTTKLEILWMVPGTWMFDTQIICSDFHVSPHLFLCDYYYRPLLKLLKLRKNLFPRVHNFS
jgi:hypothetical protein